MASQLNPYLHFDGTARQAVEFYQQVFGGTLQISTYGDAGVGEGPHADKVMHADLETDRGFRLMASDVPPGMEHRPASGISLSVTGDDDAELRDYWAKLSADGSIAVPLEKQVWGDVFGMCTDRFGITWMVNISQ